MRTFTGAVLLCFCVAGISVAQDVVKQPAVAKAPGNARKETSPKEQKQAPKKRVVNVAPIAVVRPALAVAADEGEQFLSPEIVLLKRHAAIQCGLAKRVCELSDEQIAKLAEMDVDWLTRAFNTPAAQEANLDQIPENGFAGAVARFFGVRQPNAPRNDPEADFNRVCEQVDDYVESVLEVAQRDELRKEQAAREQFRREAAAKVFTVTIDDRVCLRDGQCAALENAIQKWIGEKNYYLALYLQNSDYLPNIPSSVLSEVLDQKQQQQIRSISRTEMTSFQFDIQVVDRIPGLEFDDD